MVEKTPRHGQGGTAVLCSAGLDSAVLLADQAARGPVTPVYVSCGLAWEPAERGMLARLLSASPLAGTTAPPVVLQFGLADLYPPGHWAVTGQPPAFDTPDEDVYLVGRNLVLLTRASILCVQHGLARIVLGVLSGNPFPDATDAFFDAVSRSLSLGLGCRLEIAAPFREWSKADVVRRGCALGVPFGLTLSCMNPRDALHCGRCSKCRERRDAFRDAGIEDPARYVVPPLR
jgi:7-cyano-7-deazaguanine synthase